MSAFVPWKILHLDLSNGICALDAEPNYQRIYAVFWWRSIPLGDCEILAAQLPMTAAQLTTLALKTIAPAVGDRLLPQGFKAFLPVAPGRLPEDTLPNFEQLMAINNPLTSLQKQLSHHHNTSVSVIICTRDRPEQLAQCLQSLQHLSTSPAEILVVDNAPSSDATRQLVAQVPNVRYVLEPQPGLSKARNAGIRHSTGEIIAFTDDDVMVHPDWIARLQQSFCAPDIMAVTGLVLPGALDTEAQVIFEKELGGFNQGYRVKTFDKRFFQRMVRRGVPVWRIGAGANMAFRREAFERVGEFNEQLGAGAAGCSEDSEFWYRLLAEGWSCQYEPAAVVFHYHRSNLDSLQHQAYQYMRGHVAALLIQFNEYKHWGNLRRLCIALPRYYLTRSLTGLSTGLLTKSKSVNRTFTSEVLGCLSGVKFYLQHQYFGKSMYKAPLGNFLSHNPFPNPLTLGFFYREKMRAIHRIAPDHSFQTILEVGGGRGGLTALLYPNATITNIDLDPSYAQAPCNLQKRVHFVCGDATSLPFGDRSFDAVTMFDVLEHIPDHKKAISEALRVLKPGGFLLISSPNENWRFPYYPLMKPVCPTEADVMAEWGHVRRGYTVDELMQLIGLSCQNYATFINPLTVISHDVAFSRLSRRKRQFLCKALSPITWLSYLLHTPHTTGTETASAWQMPKN